MVEILIITLVSSAFIKLATTLSIFQYGLGLRSFSFSLIVFLFSIILTLFVMQPTLNKIGGWEGIKSADTEKLKSFQSEVDPFVLKHTDSATLERLHQIYKKNNPEQAGEIIPWSVKITAFMVSELKEAFYIGLLLIIPFIFLDLLIVNVLMALNITQISALTVALPFKLLVFYLFDGWQLLTEKLLSFYS